MNDAVLKLLYDTGVPDEMIAFDDFGGQRIVSLERKSVIQYCDASYRFNTNSIYCFMRSFKYKVSLL